MLHSATSARRVVAGVGAAVPETAHSSAEATTESRIANLTGSLCDTASGDAPTDLRV